ncbi:hypothetical protein MK786_13560 [Microbacterium sp. CFH 31415]|uniref:hypothetical protein n=1 Tax=Microbacterium sp. CFH 31415 TaxID=2921732 RepID=UPI001F14528D|nr:hypothetical protein [Microbacterium sp. CFH 31415]MCH6231773.1 hypothetical protein [Microbacterium sp. CFH 31415]
MPASPTSSRRPRRIVRTTPVIATADDGLNPAPLDLEAALRAAVVEAGEEIARAERALGRSRVARARAASDLEEHVHPLTLDEAERARLRAAYASADADVAAKQSALADARAFAEAALTVADALELRAVHGDIEQTFSSADEPRRQRALSRVTADATGTRAAASALPRSA